MSEMYDAEEMQGDYEPKKILTDHVYPPIPIRWHDWIAYYDGDEECGLRGIGETEQQAIDDLLSQEEN